MRVQVAYANSWPPDEVEVVFTDGSRVEMNRDQYVALTAYTPT